MNTPTPILIARPEDVKKRVDDLARRSDDIKSRVAVTLKKLWKPERKLASVEDLNIFADLKVRFPNFIECIELFEANAIGLSKFGLPFESTPILLLGESGLGKTYFVSELAKLMKLPFYEISMATISASFALSGGSVQWSEGSVGFIADSLASSEVGNPIILIDEIDKSQNHARFNPMSCLYTLLEPHSAKRFKDEALEIEMDASKVIWITTANDKGGIPEPILSRMLLIDIEQPDREQMKKVIESIYSNFRKSKPYGTFMNPQLSEDIMNALAIKSPRDARIAIDTGCLAAIRSNRKDLQLSDLPIAVKESNRVGFY